MKAEAGGSGAVVEMPDVTDIKVGVAVSVRDGVHDETGVVVKAVDSTAKTLTVDLATAKQAGATVEVRADKALVTVDALAKANLITAADLAVTKLDMKALGGKRPP